MTYAAAASSFSLSVSGEDLQEDVTVEGANRAALTGRENQENKFKRNQNLEIDYA